MKRRTLLGVMPLALLLPGGTAEAMKLAFASREGRGGAVPGSTAVYELRIYHVSPGKIEDLVARFRDHTMTHFCETWNQKCGVLDGA